jgi:hypothetical protein
MRKTMRLLEQSKHQNPKDMNLPEGSPMKRKIRVYGAQVISTIVILVLLYAAARYEVMGVLRNVSRNDVVASPQTR